MGKVQVTIDSPFIPSNILLQLTQAMVPSEDDWHTACLQFLGVVPEHINITIEEVK